MNSKRLLAVGSIAGLTAIMLGFVIGTLLMPASALALEAECDTSCGLHTPYGECHHDHLYSCEQFCDGQGCYCIGADPSESGCGEG